MSVKWAKKKENTVQNFDILSFPKSKKIAFLRIMH